MTDAPVFAFVPATGRIECSAFSAPFKALAVTLVTLAMVWGWRMWASGLLEPSLQSSGWLVAALCMMAYTQWHILRGKTTLDGVAIQQTWVWSKRTELRDLAYAKLIRVRGFEWLIAPRLYTKTFSNKLAVFYAASPVMLAEFHRLEQELGSHQKTAP
ncbi:MAG: hypothetical protein RIS34_576 [Pseudomonadota bacterium]